MIKEENKEFLEECKKDVKLFSKETMIREFSTACADVMELMKNELDSQTTVQLIVALTAVSGKTIKRLFEENKNMANYSEREDV